MAIGLGIGLTLRSGGGVGSAVGIAPDYALVLGAGNYIVLGAGNYITLPPPPPISGIMTISDEGSITSDGSVLTIVINAPSVYAGTYTVTIADLASGPVCIIPAVISGSAPRGNTLTTDQPGVWVNDATRGAPVVTGIWRNGTLNIDGETGATFVTGDGNVGSSVNLYETAIDSAGSRSQASNGITVTAVSATYIEAAVLSSSNDFLDKYGDLGVDTGRLLIYLGGIIPATMTRARLISQAADEGWGWYDSTPGFRFRMATPGGSSLIFNATPGLAGSAGQRLNLLMSIAPNGSALAYKAYYRIGAGAWTLGASGTGLSNGSLFDLSRGAFRFGERLTSLGQPYNASLYRHAIWTGLSSMPDIATSGVRNNFCDATTGVTVDPAVSVAAYGIPRFDVYGPASDYNAKINHGSVGNFNFRSGNYT